MALINCKECKKEISSTVKQCPHCGSNKHRGFIKKHPVLMLVIGLCVMVSLPTAIVGNKQNQTSNQLPLKNEQKEGSDQISYKNVKEEPIKETVKAPIIVENWKYQTDEDKMRNTKNSYATSISTNTVNLDFPYNNSKMAITIRNMNNETDVLISVKGQIVCNSYSERCYLNVKDDNNPIVKYDFNEAAHGNSDTVFIKKQKDFISLLKKSKHLIIEAPMYDSGRIQYEFDVSGLKWD